MRRVVLKLTERQAEIVRGAIRAWKEYQDDWSETQEKLAQDILWQASQPARDIFSK